MDSNQPTNQPTEKGWYAIKQNHPTNNPRSLAQREKQKKNTPGIWTLINYYIFSTITVTLRALPEKVYEAVILGFKNTFQGTLANSGWMSSFLDTKEKIRNAMFFYKLIKDGRWFE